MPSKERVLDAKLNAFLEDIKRKKRSKVTVDGYYWQIAHVQRLLENAPVESNPSKWTEETVRYIQDVIYAGLRPGMTRRYMSVLSTYAQFHKNPIIKNMQLEWPRDERIHADWLTPEEALRVISEASGMERMVVHLELNLGLRRVEVIRLKLSDIGSGYINVLGKGRQGGKPRTISFHPEIIAELTYYLRLRELEVESARAKNPGVMVPDNLLIYERRGKLHQYQRTAIDNRLKWVAKRTNLKFTNHTLRRTYGRTLWLAGVEIEKIARLMGHEDTRTTILYLGINMDDMQDAMQKLTLFQNALKSGKTSMSQQKKWTERDLKPQIILAR